MRNGRSERRSTRSLQSYRKGCSRCRWRRASLQTAGEAPSSRNVRQPASLERGGISINLNYPDIEELTRKTGNYKQFAVFLSMLESAISKASESVSLDLLTYSDLEALRSKKLGTSSSLAPSPSKQLQAKRYLILTYTVEFDRWTTSPPLPVLYMFSNIYFFTHTCVVGSTIRWRCRMLVNLTQRCCRKIYET